MAGMHTHKWLSNSSAVMDKIPIQDRAFKSEFDENSSFSAKTLDVLWIAAEDNFTFDRSNIQVHKKRISKKDCNFI